MSLGGSLEDLGLAEILYVMGISRRSGVLLLESRGREVSVLFREGQIVALAHPRSPRSIEQFLVDLGITDAMHLAVLERQARREGKTVTHLLEAEGKLRPGFVEKQLEAEIDQFITSLLDVREGTFSLRLVHDVDAAAEQFGGLVLQQGLQPSKMPAVTERSRQGGGLRSLGNLAPLPKSSGRRTADLLMSEDDISLPALPPSRPSTEEGATGSGGNAAQTGTREASRSGTRPEPVTPRSTAARRVAILALAAGALRRALTSRLTSDGFETRVVSGVRDLDAAIEASLLRGASMAVLAQLENPVLPGLEALARTKVLDRSIPVIVLSDVAASPSPRDVLHDRAMRLGASHVLALPPEATTGSEPEQAADLAARLVDAVTVGAASAAATAAPPVARLSEKPLLPEGLFGSTLGEERLALAPFHHQTALLTNLARSLSGQHDLPDVALAILGAAAEYLPRGVLVLRSRDAARGFGAFAPSAADRDVAPLARRLALTSAGTDFLSRHVFQGVTFKGPLGPDPGDRAMVARLGSILPGQVVVLPIGTEKTCCGAIYGDDAGTGAPMPDLQALATFLTEVAPSLRAAVTAAEARADSRRVVRRA